MGASRSDHEGQRVRKSRSREDRKEVREENFSLLLVFLRVFSASHLPHPLARVPRNTAHAPQWRASGSSSTISSGSSTRKPLGLKECSAPGNERSATAST